MCIIIFLYGLILGSFYNVVGLRVPAGKSIVAPRSTCSLCGHQLTARDLVPVFSYILLRGKCRKCGVDISPLYPVTELLTALFFLYSYVLYGWTWTFAAAVLLVSMMMILVVSDLAYMLIPDKILLFFAVLFLILRLIDPLQPWWNSIIGAAAGFFLLLAVAIVSKGGMGGGDIKLFGLLGFVFGTKLVLLTFFLSCLFGAMVGLFLLFFGIVKKGKPMPFGPFIAMGAFAAFFHGADLIGWYVQFFK
ncbi:prepilin peptidase [Domibacillus iocasae]|uniref:Prepilin peptidase n=1 Tax=Domibacillus iocasae TaxID=1714016 RepID=A0A1E7DNM5_9BACI|nr:A24 family peptidase [Domibacillus iocasae]OES44649.1 prepilin peptidase [Domibacillus iocasae]